MIAPSEEKIAKIGILSGLRKEREKSWKVTGNSEISRQEVKRTS